MARTCVFCGRPAASTGRFLLCREHSIMVEREYERERKAKNAWRKGYCFARYKGWIVVFWLRGGRLIGELLTGVSWKSIPKEKKYDLDAFVPRLDKWQARILKGKVKQIAAIP